MDIKHAIITWNGNYICPNCFGYLDSLFHLHDFPHACTCGQRVSYNPDKDYDLYVKKSKMTHICMD